VAPPGNQAANGEIKHQPVALGDTGLLDSKEGVMVLLIMIFGLVVLGILVMIPYNDRPNEVSWIGVNRVHL
jgi:hypothetical protein